TWFNDAVNVNYVNQTAALVSQDLPEEWGAYHQSLTLEFAYYEQAVNGAANNIPLAFTPAGGSALTFTVVNRWAHSADVERFSPLHAQRRQTTAKIRVEGQYFGDTTAALATRRTALAALAKQFNAGMNSAEGVLSYGAVFTGSVRVDDWACDVDQAVNAIAFSFTAHYILFPDPAGYATADFTVEEKDNFTGELDLAIVGRVQTQTEAAARATLAGP